MKKGKKYGSLLACAMVIFGWAERSWGSDQKEYHLFNPAPPEIMRPLSADRPDLTESPYTVDAGHFQLEMDVFSYSYDRHQPDGDAEIESFAVAPFNLKAGLNHRMDLQLIIETYQHVRIEENDRVRRQRGFGDVLTRLKVNLWGNDGGPTALGVMPFVKFPTNQDDLGNDAVEGGLIVPFAMELPKGWGLGLMTEVDLAEDEDGSGYHPEFVNTIVFGRDLIGNLGGYIEFFSLVSTESDWIGSVDLGMTYQWTRNFLLDWGVNIGVTRAADDINPFVGFTWRF